MLEDYVKVQVNIDTDRTHERFADQFNLNTYPSLFVMFDPEHHVSSYLFLEMNQVWVAQDTLQKGNFMPLSEASFSLSVTRATILARKAANMEESSGETPP